MDLDTQELQSKRPVAGLDCKLAASEVTMPHPANSVVEPASDMTAKVSEDSMTRQNVAGHPGKPNGMLAQARYTTACGVTLSWDAKYTDERKPGVEHIGVLSCPSSATRKRAAGSPETPILRGKIDVSKYSRGTDSVKVPVFGRTQNMEMKHWPGQVRSPACRFLPQKTNSRVLALGANAAAIKGPPPISRHPALLKTLNGHCAMNQSALFVGGSGQPSSSRHPVASLESSLYHGEGKMAIQSAKETLVSAGEAYQGVRVNRQALLLRKDSIAHLSCEDSSRMAQEHKPAGSQGTRRSVSADRLNFISQKMGGIQPIRLYKEKSQRDSGDQGGTGAVGTTRSNVRSPTIPERGEQPGRFLLIDSKGLPYTVFLRESKSSGPRAAGSGMEAANHWVEAPAAPRKLYSCPVCSRVFEYLSYLQRHSITHSEQKPHICQECGKAFKRTSHLERHKYTHAGAKPHRCPICQRSFRDAGELAHHQRVHTGERPYQCEVCHMRFGERNTLQRHARRKHLDTPAPPTEESAPICPSDL
ncbi:LOW QUALITY PROTEIN: zinc finger and BTB domain-containing protein 17-like [Rhinatrema bivittatum]|uniref:LOW QUALITY PROTEIN: zinc finger and BTB domain-containing protein 17-like n=1 Tax=Rhinatrema bivittatum TaxID=194408 RepID=UPI00112768DE|nr:LOW QUALITY PROTEIN: zinc finger and BTB domain-containing protein 17-like [Rhinatrema bivittatum]